VDPETANYKKLIFSLSIIGTYVGSIVEAKYLPSRKYPHFNETSLTTSLLRVVVCVIGALPTFIP